jgi:phosphatidylserine/phosphatidylglycerophosphate/cardiolipin synthase-like enzyme
MVFEGYGEPKDNQAKMQALENLGLDVRFLGRSIKVHHKFATIDSGLARERVISGSANWSLSSYRFYNENILFFETEPEANYRFQMEFERLWERAKEFGVAQGAASLTLQPREQADLDFHFNSPRRLQLNPNDALLTDHVVRAIDNARQSIAIASTRVRLAPVLEAIAKAAERGVAVRVILGQDDFHDLYKRSQWLVRSGVQLRIKFYNLKPSQFLTHQMHNKFMIIDDEIVLTGSFNWSESAERNHIENIVEIKGVLGQKTAYVFMQEFESIWQMGRDGLESFKIDLERLKAAGEKPRCFFSPIVMDPAEIRDVLRLGRNCGT